MYSINGTTITLTKGDSFYCQLSLTKDGESYTPEQGDVIRFAMKKKYWDQETIIEKVIPNDTLLLALTPQETNIDIGNYEYDMEITFANGDVDTFINQKTFSIVPEVRS